jgi:NAD(P)-dependent dehydrogenase (short-subunit alcohol dehydrogenase family)
MLLELQVRGSSLTVSARKGERTAVANLEFKHAVIVGAGAGLSASLARALAHEGLAVSLAARSTEDLADLVQATGARAFACDASKRSDVERLFGELDAAPGSPDIVIYNASFRTRGPLCDLDPADVERALSVTAFGAFLVAQQATRRMLPKKTGAILLTGASAGVKGYPQSAPFAMGKFALRGLAQSMARELHPQGIHVAHVVVDGGIRSARRPVPSDKPDSLLDPDAIAQVYLHLIGQPRSAWSWEVEVRPWVEHF